MSFNTNGWDYIYTVNLTKLNQIISGKIAETQFRNLFNTTVEATFKENTNPHGFKIEGYGNVAPNIIALQVLNTSHYPEIHLGLKIKCKITGSDDSNSFNIPLDGITVKISINVDWLNQENNTNPTTSELKYIGVDFGLITINPTQQKFVQQVFEMYYNRVVSSPFTDLNITNPTVIDYSIYQIFFKILNPHKNINGSGLSVERFNVKRNVHKLASDDTCFFSFSCMKADSINNDIGYVDLNIIQTFENSSLVLDRKFFLGLLVKNINKNISTIMNSGEENKITPVQLITQGQDSYSYVNDHALTLKTTDYKDGDNKAVIGKVSGGNFILKGEESLLSLTIRDAEYDYSKTNKAICFQDYSFVPEWKDTELQIISNERQFLISNNYQPNTKDDWIINTVIPFGKVFLVNHFISSFEKWQKEIRPYEFFIEKKNE